ncbi:hypothetical protein H6G54_28055 [Anabaena cylindrica FACHB-243]|nr:MULTISPECIES: hypothetical protein [Anabaena]MBD2421464.1 hypothetical protein [Anabaena cylindrica FACHB-243]MBY5285330.1 hypothetical protein [Anabaena sp. CCAP 1446/1C]MCM2407778.1 hypothetical protein [Anabaena sp. CCAP 1446/1C]
MITAEVRSQESGVRSQESGVRSQEEEEYFSRLFPAISNILYPESLDR